MDRCNRIEDAEKIQTQSATWSLTKSPKSYARRKIASLKNVPGETGYSHTKDSIYVFISHYVLNQNLQNLHSVPLIVVKSVYDVVSHSGLELHVSYDYLFKYVFICLWYSCIFSLENYPIQVPLLVLTSYFLCFFFVCF